jgi:hypothetical protein
MMESQPPQPFWSALLERAQQLFTDTGSEQITLLLALVAGVLYCFLGYRLLKFLIGLTGFALAALAAGLMAAWLSQGNTIAVAIAGFLGGLAGAAFMYFIYRAGIFSLGLLGAALIAHHILAATALPWAPWAIVGIGVAGGLLALLIERPVITVATAALGAWILLVTGALFLMESDAADSATVQELTANASLTILATWTMLTVAGTLAQLATYRKPKPQPLEE